MPRSFSAVWLVLRRAPSDGFARPSNRSRRRAAYPSGLCRRAVRELVGADVLIWDSIGSNFVFQFRLKGQKEVVLEPIVGSETGGNFDPQRGTILPLSDYPKCPPEGHPPKNPLMEDREIESSEGPTATLSSKLPGEPATDSEFLADLFRRAQATVERPIPHSDFAAAVEQYGDLVVEQAVDKVERLGIKGSWAYYVPVLAELEKRGAQCRCRIRTFRSDPFRLPQRTLRPRPILPQHARVCVPAV